MAITYSISTIPTNNYTIDVIFSGSITEGIAYKMKKTPPNDYGYGVVYNNQRIELWDLFYSYAEVPLVTANSVLAFSNSIPKLYQKGSFNQMSIQVNGRWVNVELNKKPILSYYHHQLDYPTENWILAFPENHGIQSIAVPEFDTPVQKFNANIGDDAHYLLKKISKINNAYFTYSDSDVLTFRKIRKGDVSASLVDQILSINAEASDRDRVNRAIVVGDRYVSYANDWSDLANTAQGVSNSITAINDLRSYVEKVSFMDDEESCSTTANAIIESYKKFRRQLRVKTWGLPINLYDTVFLSNSQLGLQNTYMVYGKDTTIDSTGNYVDQYSLGEI